jgi:transaldolase/glucose-6-phosphate isomerase
MRHFVAITDPGSRLDAEAREAGFRAICAGVPGIGGRYSALSDFGMVPAAIMGLDVHRLLERARSMMGACGPSTARPENPGLVLGLVLGLAARAGRDKITFVTSPTLWDLGAWLEQLLAQSTGKRGLGLIPSDGEALGTPDRYGADRLFVELALEAEADASRESALERLSAAGHPVIRLRLRDRYDLGREFFRWEFATAVAGAVLGINPFDQPDVEASKVATRALTDEYERRGSLPADPPFAVDGRYRLYAAMQDAERSRVTAGTGAGVRQILRAHLARLGAGDYFALLAYVEMSDAHRRALQAIRHAVRDRWRVATCVGFGPRFLHSTGQAYKGGPASGVFLQITHDAVEDVQIPDRAYTFGVVQAAQARGDFQVLAERGRRALRVHLAGDVTEALQELAAMLVDIAGTSPGPPGHEARATLQDPRPPIPDS